MPYVDQENSLDTGAPFFLYEFKQGDSVFHRFTTLRDDFNDGTDVWSAIAITHTDVNHAEELSENTLTLTLPRTTSLEALFFNGAPEDAISFTLKRGHVGETDQVVYWKGRVVSHGSDRNQRLRIECESLFTSLRRSGCRARYTKACRHALYSHGCFVDKASFQTNGTLNSVNGLVLTVGGAETQADGYFTAGMIQFPDGSLRFITDHTNDKITIDQRVRYLSDVPPPFAVEVFAGCDRTLDTCRDKFNNLDNQGAFKFIPVKNPLGGQSII